MMLTSKSESSAFNVAIFFALALNIAMNVDSLPEAKILPPPLLSCENRNSFGKPIICPNQLTTTASNSVDAGFEL